MKDIWRNQVCYGGESQGKCQYIKDRTLKESLEASYSGFLSNIGTPS